MNGRSSHIVVFESISVVGSEQCQERYWQTRHPVVKLLAAYLRSPRRYVAHHGGLPDVYLCLGVVGSRYDLERRDRNDGVPWSDSFQCFRRGCVILPAVVCDWALVVVSQDVVVSLPWEGQGFRSPCQQARQLGFQLHVLACNFLISRRLRCWPCLICHLEYYRPLLP